MKSKMICIGLLLCSLSSLALYGGDIFGENLPYAREKVSGAGIQSESESDSEVAQSDVSKEEEEKQASQPVMSKEEEKEEEGVASSDDEKQDQISSVADSSDKGAEEEDKSSQPVMSKKEEKEEEGNLSDLDVQPGVDVGKKEEVKKDEVSPENEKDLKAPQKPQGLWEAAKNMTAVRLAALMGAVSLLGYGAYKGYELLMAWWQDYVEGEQPVKITEKERDILVSLMEAMAEDVKCLRDCDGTQQSSAVKKFDIGGLSMPLAIECNFMQHGFIELYNQCGQQGNNVDVDTLEMFYSQFNEVVRSVIARAEIVLEDEVQEALAA